MYGLVKNTQGQIILRLFIENIRETLLGQLSKWGGIVDVNVFA